MLPCRTKTWTGENCILLSIILEASLFQTISTLIGGSILGRYVDRNSVGVRRGVRARRAVSETPVRVRLEPSLFSCLASARQDGWRFQFGDQHAPVPELASASY